MNDRASTRPPDGSGPRHGSRLLLAVSMVLSLVAIILVVGAVVASLTAEPEPLPAGSATAREDGVGVCLAADFRTASDHSDVLAAFEARTESMPHMFPRPSLVEESGHGSPDVTRTVAAVWPIDAGARRVDEWRRGEDREGCTIRPQGWTVRVTRDLLADGADRTLAAAEFSDDWTAVMEVKLDAAESTVRTILHFSGPLNISGSCWIDDILGNDPETGTLTVSSVAGDDAGLAGLVACRTFAESLPHGAAGEQALSLVPTSLNADTGSGLRLLAEAVVVSDDAILFEGTFAPQPA